MNNIKTKIKNKIQTHPQKKAIILLIIFVLVMLMLISTRIWDAIALRNETKAHQILPVALIEAQSAPSEEEISLPGTVLAWHEAPIYARTSGYINAWHVDIGSRVKKGDLLAKIEAPEIDAQLRQAEADLNVAIADDKLAQITAQRWVTLQKNDWVSRQAKDEKVANAAALSATVISKRADRDRLNQLVDFQRIVAPFEGIISDRTTDIGALINTGSTPDQQKPLFRMVQINPLRLYINVPQAYAARIRPNMNVRLQFAQHPGKVFPARLLETAHAIDPTTRTLLSQFVVENKEGELLPGSYTMVRFSIPTFPQAVRLPINTLIFRKEGLQVATIDKESRVLLKNVTINRDFGNFVEIASGVTPGEAIIINPSDSIYTGQQVQASKMD